MSKTYSLLLNVKVDTNTTSDGKKQRSYFFKAWKDGKITKNALAFDWDEPIVRNQSGKMQELGEKIFAFIQDQATKQG
ncbi:hypothetical protein [Fibrobacter intestinalis]|uniref:Uncharacterized protein n=1 Tax=Fibrobacter intestinalis TaxID=28122 RepID=A0A1T4PE42_9BACT|nr:MULTISPECIES: hypothetical protein [Fibrobacter]PBC75089.1 hypothetical protein BGW94_2772 [Fibrobacter sp. NR9]SJZ89078.1 hypothetical protein SAMN02745108_01872 [Fibrobacter intestinalis]